MHKLKSHYLTLKVLFKSKDHKFKRIRAIKKGMRAGKRYDPPVEYPKNNSKKLNN